MAVNTTSIVDFLEVYVYSLIYRAVSVCCWAGERRVDANLVRFSRWCSAGTGNGYNDGSEDKRAPDPSQEAHGPSLPCYVPNKPIECILAVKSPNSCRAS